MKGARPCRASNPQRGSIEPAPSPAFRPPLRRRPGRSAPRLFFDLRGGGAPASLSSLCASSDAAAVVLISRRLVSRPARARAPARLARLAARGPAPRSRTAPIRERGCRRGSHCRRRRARRRPRRHPSPSLGGEDYVFSPDPPRALGLERPLLWPCPLSRAPASRGSAHDASRIG